MNNKMKRLIATASLGLMIGLGIGATSHIVAKASDTNTSAIQSESSEFYITFADVDDFEKFSENPVEWTNKLVKDGVITKEEGDLQIAYYTATTEEDKQKAYENFINHIIPKEEMTQSESSEFYITFADVDDFEKFSENPVEWTNKLVKDGVITKEEGDLQIAYYNATTEEDKQKAYEDFIDYLVSSSIED